MVFSREEDLERASIPYFEENFTIFALQVPLHSRIIDLVALDNEGHLIGVEFKLKDWRRGINQAIKNTTTFDFNYVCVPGGRYMDRLKIAAADVGIGIMIYDNDSKSIRVELKAKKSKYKWSPNCDAVKSYLRKHGLGEY